MAFTTVIPDPITCRSGAVGDIIASRNAYGPYIRARSPVTNPDTPAQQSVRATFAALVAAWKDTLTSPQRQNWYDYAHGNDLRNYCDQPVNRHGQGEFIHANLARVHAGLHRIDTPPSTYALPQFEPPTITQWQNVNQARVAFDLGDYADQDGAALLIYCSPQLPTTRHYHTRPHQLAAVIQGDSSTPPASPTTINLPTTIDADSNLNFKTQLATPDARVSAPHFQTLLWETPPALVQILTATGPAMLAIFDKPLDPLSTPEPFRFLPKLHPRTDTTVWRYLAGTTIFIDPFQPQICRIDSNGSTQILVASPQLKYNLGSANPLKHATLPLLVQPFDHTVPYP